MKKQGNNREKIPKVLLIFILVLLGIGLYAQNTTSGGFIWSNPFASPTDTYAPVTYHNPVIPGFYSDPSVCRVGEDYYLVTSTFEYFPGVPVFHSKDLVNWEQIGYCINRKEQLPGGFDIYASTIRYHDGTYYMITTSVRPMFGNFYLTATDPAGPWSDPVWVKAGMIDPDLFFDDNGKSYFISSDFKLYEIDLKTGKLLSEGRKVWFGSGGRYPEGPHIYKKDGLYYLMAAEGGTEEAHSETIARSSSIWGPYVNSKDNPILTNCNLAGQSKPIQGIGHADMVQAHNGSWWMVFHGYRKVDRWTHHILGRETCLASVSWPKNEWPVVNGNGTVDINMTCPTLPLKPFPDKSDNTDFTEKKLSLDWNYIQLPDSGNYSLDELAGFLRLKGSALRIGEKGSPTFIGQRVRDLYFSATTRMEFKPAKVNEEAGMILLNNGSCFSLIISGSGNKRYLLLNLQFGKITYKSERIELKPGPVNLRIEGEKSAFTFSYSQGDAEYKKIETADSKFLSSETAGGYTGLFVGLYATGNGKPSTANAYIDWFEYKKLNR